MRTRLVLAAARLFVERGFLQTSVEDLLGAARISRASFYTYFENKIALLAALVDEHIERRTRHFHDLAQLGRPDVEQVASWFKKVGETSREQAGIVRLMRLAVALDPGLMQRFVRARDKYAEILGENFPRLDLSIGDDDEREARRATAHLLIIQVEQFASSSADGSWYLDVDITSRTFARLLMRYA
ncbi:TetR/AcrR family transcriptional regulator [Rhizorhabdus histidinilytica]|uniref:Transcriptional regulator, TetR family n=1 Tax=Rhizorhabdus histidinilytica TaxID=439228 RepID=A0A1T4ZTQ7_9SPHN|nr:TetR/AcrR family transcriptional regulator [Rhizorhabdus histidinilytica]SKB25703.1 transcriptional regulator, TetR family [Rhizorhabdus histidinilytica]